jgi:gas vesicle protein
MDRHHKLIYGLGTGVIIGTAAGLLLAPKTGKETRIMVATRAGDLRHKATLYFGNLRRERFHRRKAERKEAVHE